MPIHTIQHKLQNMRTKTLICFATAIAAGVATSMAQSNVYSLNIVGYVNKTFTGGTPAKFTAVSNPLNTTNNTLNNLINGPQVPLFANYYRWTGAGFQVATYTGTWDTNLTVNPGEGGFLLTDTTFTNTFVGEVVLDSTNHFNSGFSFKASAVPQAANLDALGLSASLGLFDNVLLWDFGAQGYVTYTYTAPGWSSPPGTPSVGVAESFFINSSAPGDWVRHFTVGP